MKILKRKLQPANNPTHTMKANPCPKTEIGRDGALRRPRAEPGAERIFRIVRHCTKLSDRCMRSGTAQRAVPTFARMALSAALLLAVPLVASSQNQIPAAINYQGRLTDTLGNPVSSGYYEVEFRIWDDATLANAGDLIWGRSFPLHVVTNGLFNVLLTDAGGQVTTPTTPTNSLLDAFSGPDRYLGLTITLSNNVPVSGPEISPRQQLASAPYAIQAQQANTVGPLGVPSTALAANSVVAGKIADNAVTSSTIQNGAVLTGKIADGQVTAAKLANGAVAAGKIADNAVTSATIADGAVTSAKLNIDGDIHLNDYTLYLKPGGNGGLAWNGASFAGINLDGPVLYGYDGGLLGTIDGGSKVALRWDHNGSVSLFGSLVNLSSYVQAVGQTPQFTAHCDGLMMFYGRRGQADLQVWNNNGSTPLFPTSSTIKGITFYYDVDHGDGKSVMWPIKNGWKFQWNIRALDTSSTYKPDTNTLYFLPMGLAEGGSSVTEN